MHTGTSGEFFGRLVILEKYFEGAVEEPLEPTASQSPGQGGVGPAACWGAVVRGGLFQLILKAFFGKPSTCVSERSTCFTRRDTGSTLSILI